MFKQAEKNSLFGSVVNRLSFRSKRIKDTRIDATSIQKKVTESSSESKTFGKDIAKKCHLKDFVPQKTNLEIKNTDEQGKESFLETSLGDCIIPIPSSSTYRHSRPISELDTALKSFQLDAVKSRKSLSLSKAKISADISQSTNKPLPASSLLKNCPATPYSCWRQKPPSANIHLDSEWKKLSASMLSINQTRREQLWKETDLATTDVNIMSSNHSLDTSSLAVTRENVEEMRVTRAKSMNVLDMPREEKRFQIPSNQLMQMNQYQRRVQVSMEKLSVPSWYNPSSSYLPCTTTPCTPSWRQSGGSSSSSTGWRRHISHSSSSSTASRLERNSTPLSSQRYRSKFSTFPSSTRSPSISSINSSVSSTSTSSNSQYLGWRSQERPASVPAYLTSPAQRLASSAARLVSRPASLTEDTATIATAHEGIKEISEAILDFCNNSLLGDQPPQVKETWPCIDDNNDISNDNMDDDSGIDRSDDSIQENINS